MTNAAVSTSGNSEQHVDIDGRRYSHIIDPASGTGLVSNLTVTVIADHGLYADGLDTAISVLGPERGLALVDSHRAAAFVIEGTGAQMKVHTSKGFKGFKGFRRFRKVQGGSESVQGDQSRANVQRRTVSPGGASLTSSMR